MAFPSPTVLLVITNLMQFVQLILNIEEYPQSTHNCCNENAICSNTIRSFIWSCNPGCNSIGMDTFVFKTNFAVADICSLKKETLLPQTIVEYLFTGRWNDAIIAKKTKFQVLKPVFFLIILMQSFMLADIGWSKGDISPNFQSRLIFFYRAPCAPSYTFKHFADSVIDIDECAHEIHNCSMDSATCKNTEGSYRCICKHGFTGNENKCKGKILQSIV